MTHRRREDFPPDFLWGVATASYQIEGAVHEDGRKPSIWDSYSHTPGKVAFDQNGDVATDHYHRFREDVALMKQLGVQAYRFSIAWPRIIPDGRGSVNEAGVAFYHSLIDELLRNDILPVATLYHWDLPQALEDEGGWPNRETATAFAEYAQVCFDRFPEVRRWITLNEPFCSSILGYHVGRHAPGHHDHQAAINALHHLLLAHGLALERYRRGGYDGEIGITLNMTTPRPATQSERDRVAADRAADLTSRMFLHPLLGRGYCDRYLDTYGLTVPIVRGDRNTIAGKIDFLGVNFYWEDAVAHDENSVEQYRVVPTYQPRSTMGWPATPEGLIRHLRWIAEHTGTLPLYITENGVSLDDTLTEGISEGPSEGYSVCHDPRRIDYLRDHFSVCKRAIREGIPLKGYFLWSFLDNFEWAYGYQRRFGIVYCDYVNQRRVPKDSYYFFRDVVCGMEPIP